MSLIVVLLESMWGWGGFNDAGEEAPRHFAINPDNFSGRRLYRLMGNYPFVVTNCCRTVQRSANDHGKPDTGWVLTNLTELFPISLLLVCGRISRETFAIVSGYRSLGYDLPSHGEVSLPGMGANTLRFLCMDHPAARRWSNEKLDAMKLRITQELTKCRG